MFLQQGSGSSVTSGGGTFTLSARLKSAVASSQLKISVTYLLSNLSTNVLNYPQCDTVHTTNNTASVTLLSAPLTNMVNIIEYIKIYNPDTNANTVEILAGSDPICGFVVNPNETLMISESGIKVFK